MCLRLDYILQQLMLFNHIILSIDWTKPWERGLRNLDNFQQSQYDLSLFLCKTSHGITILLAYFDDIIITGDDLDRILQVATTQISSCFISHDGFRSFENFLRLEFHKNPIGLLVNHH